MSRTRGTTPIVTIVGLSILLLTIDLSPSGATPNVVPSLTPSPSPSAPPPPNLCPSSRWAV
jgi:hypothetical protein